VPFAELCLSSAPQQFVESHPGFAINRARCCRTDTEDLHVILLAFDLGQLVAKVCLFKCTFIFLYDYSAKKAARRSGAAHVTHRGILVG